MSTTMRNNLSKLMKQAWNMVKKSGYTMAEAMKVAWKSMKLKEAMKNGVVRFSFKKKDGSIRKAVGTLCKSFLPVGTDERGNRKENFSAQVYFDCEKQEFRSYVIANLI